MRQVAEGDSDSDVASEPYLGSAKLSEASQGVVSHGRIGERSIGNGDFPPPAEAVTQAPPGQESVESWPAQAAVGMRGGLGRTLLTAFLLLTILPLTVTTLFASTRIRQDVQRELTDRLDAVLSFKASQLAGWLQRANREMDRLAYSLSLLPGAANAYVNPLQHADIAPDASILRGLLLVDSSTSEVLYSYSPGLEVQAPSGWDALHPETPFCVVDAFARERAEVQPSDCQGLGLVRSVGGAWLVGLLHPDPVVEIVADPTGLGLTGRVRLVLPGGAQILADGVQTEPLALVQAPPGTEEGRDTFTLAQLWSRREPSIESVAARALAGESGFLAYAREDGERVFGVYRWLPDLDMALLASQTQQEVMAASEDLVALIIAVTLAAALLTAPIAALVARRITTPIVQLTVSASRMSKGHLSARVEIERHDEIGLLARAFNRMAAELQELYSGLESKVRERTRQLAEATARARHHAMQLAISAEVARIVTSIRDLDTLLTTVAQTIANTFGLSHVSIYLLEGESVWAVRQAGSVPPEPGADRVAIGGPTLVGQVAADGRRRMAAAVPIVAGEEDPGIEADGATECELAVPLQAQGRLLGVIDLRTQRHTVIDDSDQLVYQSLADQISIAIENAQAYAAERKTIARLRELDRIQAQFLTNMSHALRTPLTSIIGFSRILGKGLDGPLTDVQREDVSTIYQSGRQLLGLINDMLELSQLQIGTAPFSVAQVNLAEIIEGVMATARALALGKPVRLYQDLPDDLPLLYTDGQRVRQVILALLSNAVKFTDEGEIHLRVALSESHVTVSVQDTGVGIPGEERSRVFADTPYGDEEDSETAPGFGLAISKRVVEKLGGQIWVDSEEAVGSVFTFTLPIQHGQEPSLSVESYGEQRPNATVEPLPASQG